MIVRPLTQRYRYALLLAVFSFLSMSSSFAQVTWIGGNSSWNNPANWNTGAVPTAADIVILPNNIITIPNGYSATAKSVEVRVGARLNVNAAASLTIEHALSRPGLTANGTVNVFGSLKVLNTSNLRAISVEGSFFVGSSSNVVIDQSYHGIYVDGPGVVSSQGEIFITNISASCVFNKSLFYNFGTMDLIAGTNTAQTAIANFKNFYNFSNGTIDIQGGGTQAVINNATGTMVNYGELSIKNTANGGLSTSGVFYNHYSGDLDISNAGIKGIYVSPTGSFYNFGNTLANHSPNGMFNVGYVRNNGQLNLIGKSSGFAYRDWPSATFENDDVLYLQSSGNNSARFTGQFTNRNAGNIFVHKKCFFLNAATVENYGFLTASFAFPHYKHPAATVSNYRMINDINGSFGSNIDNQQVVTQPLTTPLQNGVPFANPIDVFSLSNVTIGAWRTAPNSPIAGIYNAATNVFTPNATAIGATQLRVLITNNSTGNSYLATVKLSAPILPMVANQDVDHLAHKDRSLVASEVVMIFPNPSIGQFEIKSSLFEKGEVQLEVYSALGQLVIEKQFAKYDSPQVTLPATLDNGQYIVRLIGADGTISTSSLQLIR